MTCTEIQPELVAYQFGETPLDERTDIERHLVECRDCLTDFLALKREIETGDRRARPSPDTRARLRRAVAAEFAPDARPRPWSWWERPAAFVCAGATVVAAMVFAHAIATSPGAMPRSLEHEPDIVEEAP